MNMLDKPRETLLQLLSESDFDLKSLSEKIGRNSAYLQQYVTRGSPRELGEADREAVARLLCVDPDIFRSEGAQSRSKRVKAPGEDSSALRVPEIDVRPQAGMGAVVSDIVEHQQPIDHWSFPRALVSAFISDPSKLTIIRVAGDSMEPDYCAGDRILVDTGHTTPSPAGVYVLWDGLGVVLKRVEVVMGSKPKRIRIMSINPAYPAYELALDDVRINGRVVGKWTWK